MKEGEVATLECSGAQVIAWYHNRTQRLLTNELADEKGNGGKFVIVDSILNVTKVSKFNKLLTKITVLLRSPILIS
jgi:hypothetical protein